MVSKLLKAECHCCGAAMCSCEIPYSEWVELDSGEREQISKRLLRSEKDK